MMTSTVKALFIRDITWIEMMVSFQLLPVYRHCVYNLSLKAVNMILHRRVCPSSSIIFVHSAEIASYTFGFTYQQVAPRGAAPPACVGIAELWPERPPPKILQLQPKAHQQGPATILQAKVSTHLREDPQWVHNGEVITTVPKKLATSHLVLQLGGFGMQQQDLEKKDDVIAQK